MWQASGTKREGHTQGDEVELRCGRRAVLLARLQDRRVAVGVHGVSEELGEVALPHHGDDQEHESNTGDQQDRLDHLHVGGALHAADEDVGHHHQADDHDDDGLGSLGVQVQQDGDEGAGTGHLSDQVEQRGEQGRESCGHAYRALLQAEGKYVRHGELTGVTQRLGDQ